MPTVTKIYADVDTKKSGKIRCAAYCRVSSSSEDQLNSYAAQIRYYSNLFESSETEELIDIYADEGISGTSAEKRDEFNRLIYDCKKGKIDRVYTKSISRYARNTKDCLESIRLLKALGVTIFFEKENIDTARMTDEMMITILGGLAQEESTSISQNQRWSLKKRMQNGTFEQSVPPYGYTKKDGKLVASKNEADIVKRIFRMYLSGNGLSSIVSILNSEGILTGNYHKKWSNHTVKYILTNEKYIGNTLLQKYYTTESIPTKQHKNNGEREQYYLSSTHEPIITHEDFYKAQELLRINTEHYYKKAGERHIFSKLLYCSNCGSTLKRKKTNNKFCWVCRNHDMHSDNCPIKAVAEADIESAFIRMTNKLILHYKEILIPLQKGLNELNNIKYRGNSKVLDIRKEIASLKEQRHVIARLRKKGFYE